MRDADSRAASPPFARTFRRPAATAGCAAERWPRFHAQDPPTPRRLAQLVTISATIRTFATVRAHCTCVVAASRCTVTARPTTLPRRLRWTSTPPSWIMPNIHVRVIISLTSPALCTSPPGIRTPGSRNWCPRVSAQTPILFVDPSISRSLSARLGRRTARRSRRLSATTPLPDDHPRTGHAGQDRRQCHRPPFTDSPATAAQSLGADCCHRGQSMDARVPLL